jgi:DNA mismatch endonuclease, patch repair protein
MDIFSKEKRSIIMSAIKSKDTKPELLVFEILTKNFKIKFIKNYAKLPGKPDFVNKRYKIVIFVHGCFWHNHHCKKGNSRPKTNTDFWTKKILENKKRDRKNSKSIRKLGWSVITIWECQIKKPQQLIKILSKKLEKAKTIV